MASTSYTGLAYRRLWLIIFLQDRCKPRQGRAIEILFQHPSVAARCNSCDVVQQLAQLCPEQAGYCISDTVDP